MLSGRGRLHFLTWLKFSRLDLSQVDLSTYLSTYFSQVNWAKLGLSRYLDWSELT